MKSLIQSLNQPFPYIYRRWLIVLIPSVVVFSIAMILKPVGLNLIQDAFEITLFFTLSMAALIALVVYIPPLIFKNYYNPDNWTKGKYFGLIFSIMLPIAPLAALTTYYICVRENIDITISPFQQLLIWYVRVFFVGVFPTVLFYFMYKNSSLKMSLNEISASLPVDSGVAEETLTLSGSTKESLKILPRDLLFAEVMGNYVTVHYLQNGEVMQKSLRITLSQIMETLDSYPQFVRCHRAFIINISNVTAIRGNSHAYQLTIHNLETEVPVSKSYTKVIKEKLNIQ